MWGLGTNAAPSSHQCLRAGNIPLVEKDKEQSRGGGQQSPCLPFCGPRDNSGQAGLTTAEPHLQAGLSNMSPGRRSNGKAEVFQSHSSQGVRKGGALGIL